MESKHTLLIVTEAALEHPEARPLSAADQARVNGVYRTYENLVPHLTDRYDVHLMTPFDWPGEEKPMLTALFNRNTRFSLPQQKTIPLVLPSGAEIDRRMEAIKPDHVHIATEGPLGLRAMLYCRMHNIPVSTAFHTNWQQYVKEDGFNVPGVPRGIAGWLTLKTMTMFHRSAGATMAATPELKQSLTELGLKADIIHIVSRGIDTNVFRPYHDDKPSPVDGDYVLVVSRIAPGKGIDRFCQLDTGGLKKVVVGTGPLHDDLKKKYPNVEFLGFRQGEELARIYAGAKLFVLPSDTETFGITVIESLACGTPVIALDRGGHQPILAEKKGLGLMGPDLQKSVTAALANPQQFLSEAGLAQHILETKSWAREATNFDAMVQTVRKSYGKIARMVAKLST